MDIRFTGDGPIYGWGSFTTERRWIDEHGEHETRHENGILVYSSDWPWWRRLWWAMGA